MKLLTLIFLFLTICLSNCFSQSVKEKIQSVYSFKITDLPAKELEVKYKELDKFWQELNADTATNLPIIRKELQRNGHSSYFYFDMSSYVEMQSYKSSDKRIIEGALKKIEWTEIGTWELVEKSRDFSLNGIDVTGLAFQLLKQEKVRLVNPETQEVFNQGKILAYLLLPLKKEAYLETISNLFDNSSAESQRSIITLLWMSNTVFGDEKLQRIAGNKTVNPEVRSYASRLMQRFPPNETEVGKYASLNPDEKKQVLASLYSKTILEWNGETWNQLIELSKLMHYFQIRRD